MKLDFTVHIFIQSCLVLYLYWTECIEGGDSPWSNWWTYEGIAGPQHWGYLNPDWVLCRSGKFQSPINIEPRWLLFDPKLRRLNLGMPSKVNGTLKNTGNNVILAVDNVAVNIGNMSDGPFMYTYILEQVHFHFGKTNNHGSEHTIDGKSFAAEIQFVCYNSNLFKSLQEARPMPYGVAILAVYVELTTIAERVNKPLSYLLDKVSNIPQQNQEIRVQDINLKSLIPETNYYLTYEGSFTQPGCQETVTWVIVNKPIFIQSTQLDKIRFFQKRQRETETTLLNGNIRPTMPLNNRVVRTNINFHTSGGLCDMKRTAFYEVNDVLHH